jgi:transposase
MSDDEIRWFVGIDWASEKHHACLLDGTGQMVGELEVVHGGAGLSDLRAWLLDKTRAEPAQVGVAIETPHGPVVEMLLEAGFAVHALNPKQLDRFRDRFSVAGAKDDSRDSWVLAGALRTDRVAFRRLIADDPLVIELREWSRMTEELTQERTRLTNQIRHQLWRYYPQALELNDDLAAEWFLELWTQAPTPAAAARISEKAVGRILKAHRVRRINASQVLHSLRQQPLSVAAATIEAARAHAAVLVARLRLINQQTRDAHRQLDKLCAELESRPGQQCEQRDVTILRSCPGIGRINLATLLAEAAEPLRRRDYYALRTLSGAAPVTRRSGKTRIVIRRHACNKRLANAVYHWARVAIQHDPVSRARYHALRSRGRGHARALRTVADRLLAVACKLLERQVLFDPDYVKVRDLTSAEG